MLFTPPAVLQQKNTAVRYYKCREDERSNARHSSSRGCAGVLGRLREAADVRHVARREISRSREIGVGDACLQQVGSEQVGIREIGAIKVRLLEGHTRQFGVFEVGAVGFSPVEADAVAVCSCEVRVHDAGTQGIDSREQGSGKIAVRQDGSF